MRLIDADALKGKESYIMMTTLDTCFGSAKIFLTETIDNAPTVDAVPVVRCGDCVLMKRKEIMTIDEAIDKIDEDLHRLDLEDIHGRESREAINYLETMRRWVKNAKERYAK